jgi:GNAT superfamily N-acetyltransferase
MLIKPLTLDVWGDFYALMNSDSQCAECWCLNHREKSGCPTGIRAHDRMKALTGQDKVGGLLAYDGNECVGWISIDPLAELIGHDCQSSAKASDWAIHCLFIRETHRGRGLSGQLISAAIDYAKSRGAKICSAFPIPEINQHRFPPNEAEFSGRFATYSRLGFVPVGEPSDFYQRMELNII